MNEIQKIGAKNARSAPSIKEVDWVTKNMILFV